VLDELKAAAGRKPSDLEFPQVDLDAYMRFPVPAQSRNRIALVFAKARSWTATAARVRWEATG